MKKFSTKQELQVFFNRYKYPEELVKEALNGISAVEECNNCGAASWLLIADNVSEKMEIFTTFSLSDKLPESDVLICTNNGNFWRERVYIFSDFGDGVIYYENTSLGCEK